MALLVGVLIEAELGGAQRIVWFNDDGTGLFDGGAEVVCVVRSVGQDEVRSVIAE